MPTPLVNSKNLLSSLDHALVILEAIGHCRSPLGLSEIVRKTGYAKTTVHRVLLTLAGRGFVRKEYQTDRYQLTLKLFEIGSTAVSQLGIKDVAKPHLEAVRNLSGETAHLAVMDDDGVFYIDKIESTQSIRMYSYIGSRAPIHCTAVGKALLAHQSDERLDKFLSPGLKAYTQNTILNKDKLVEELRKIRKQGYALDNEELEIGLFCIAAPVRNHLGEVIAAISISGPGVRLPKSRIRDLVPVMIRTGNEISAVLGYSEFGKTSAAKM
ncbi:MAG: IclR family transcriptional regulator [Gammaproteobacteria bacterium]